MSASFLIDAIPHSKQKLHDNEIIVANSLFNPITRLEFHVLKNSQHYVMQKKSSTLSRPEIDRIIMMAWEDRTSFDAIKEQFGILPGEVIKLMRHELKPSSFKLWRRRTHGRITKHEAKFIETPSGNEPRRFRAKSQRG